LAATPIVYVLLGAYAWLFVAWVVAFEWLDSPLRSNLLFKIGYVAFSVAVPLVAWRWVFPIPLRRALWPDIAVLPPESGVLEWTVAHGAVSRFLGVVVFVSLLLIPFWGRLFSRAPLAALRRVRFNGRSRVTLAVVIPVLAILLLIIRYDRALARFVVCRRLYKHKQWDALLEEAKENPFSDIRVQFMTNFALYQKRRLLDEMFHYPQSWGTRGLVLNFSGRPELSLAEDDTLTGMYNSDLFYEMGHINVAFRHVYNYMTAAGTTYDVLKRMAQCSMVNGNYAMAAKYLNMLERTLFHRDFARRYKAAMADPAAADREFGGIRKRLNAVEADMYRRSVAPSPPLLDINLDNRMAFDYLTAWLLLDKKRDSIAKICANIERFKTAGYATMPTHCQEAVLLWEGTEGAPVDLQGFTCDEATTARMAHFFREVSQHPDPRSAAEQLHARYGDTYAFYCLFVVTLTEARQLMQTRGDYGGALREE
jgi:hypothetical protein